MAPTAIINSPAWAWNEDSSTILQKYYFYYLFQKRSYPRDSFNPPDNYQAKYPTCYLMSRTTVEDGNIFPFSNTGFIYANGFT